jgi:hypothetical protein
MNLHSCQNCWFNGLQYGALGLSVGYCSRHQKILNIPDGTTCGLHLRKDLPLDHVFKVSSLHATKYPRDIVIRIISETEDERDVSTNDKDISSLRQDMIADVVLDFCLLDSKIESLAQLKALSGARAEVAMLSLARGYINNCCMQRNGKWTSGLHLYWWTKTRLVNIPDVQIQDIRTVGVTQLARQQTLIKWSVVMLRLTLIDDVVEYAATQNDPIGKAKGLLDKAAESRQTFNLRALSQWLKTEAVPFLDSKLTYERYTELSQELHKE